MKKYGLTPIARILGGATAGVAPRIIGIGPVPARRKLCARLGVKLTDFDVIELNEAFASQSIAVLRQLGIAEDAEHVNPNGGAIALGHPLGMSGARITGTAALELRERGARYGLATPLHGGCAGAPLRSAVSGRFLPTLHTTSQRKSSPSMRDGSGKPGARRACAARPFLSRQSPSPGRRPLGWQGPGVTRPRFGRLLCSHRYRRTEVPVETGEHPSRHKAQSSSPSHAGRPDCTGRNSFPPRRAEPPFDLTALPCRTSVLLTADAANIFCCGAPTGISRLSCLALAFAPVPFHIDAI